MGSSIFRLSFHLNHFWSQCGIAVLSLLVSSLHCLVLSTHFDVPAFSSMDEFYTLRDAHYVPENLSVNINSVVSSTNLDGYTYGSFLYTKEPVQMKHMASSKTTSFSTSFTFSITQREGMNRSGSQVRGSGFSFTFVTTNISKLLKGTTKKNYIKSYTLQSNLQEKFFLVEFDTFNNYRFNDPSDNHIGIDVHTLESLYTYNLCGGQTTQCSFPWTDQLYTTWIEYNIASPLLLEIWLASGSLTNGITKPSKAIFRILELDLIDVFEDYMYVGFVGGSEQYTDTFKILSWIFTSNVTKEISSISKSFSKSIIVMMSTILCIVLFIMILVSRYLLQHQWQVAKAHHNLNHLIGPRMFEYKALKKATNNFNESFLLGIGGFGIVYKGILQTPSGPITIAIKCLKQFDIENGKNTFLTEASIINQIRHRNLVQLQGWCHEGNHFLLVFDYMSNGSLDEWLYPKRRRYPNDPKYKRFGTLPLAIRCSILGGIAAALEYLHEDWVQCILHRDIKSSNVMLDNDMNPHLSDFGLARLIEHNKLEKKTLVAGTLSYMAPELPYTGKATKESDVYSFGILMLEVMCGRQPLNLQEDANNEDIVLLESVWRAHEAKNILSVVDPKLLILNSSQHVKFPNRSFLFTNSQNCGERNDCIEASSSITLLEQSLRSIEEKKITHLLHLGMICCLPNPEARPSMRVVKQLIIQFQLDSTSETSMTMLNLNMPHLPSKKPLSRYPLPGFDSQPQSIPYINNSSIQSSIRSHRRNIKSCLMATSLKHELP